MRKKTAVKRANRRRREELAAARGVFRRLNNRSTFLTIEDFKKTGYPMVRSEVRDQQNLHNLCKAIFIDGKGQLTYFNIGFQFYFVTKEDADLFRGLQYIA